MTRRNFTLFSLASLALASGGGFMLGRAEPKVHLRPPGAVMNFESLCIKCGQCVQVCPYHSIELLGFDDGLNLGTAFINASKRGCYLCDLFPCVLACPSGALSHDTSAIKDVSMGVAVVKNLKQCLAYNGQSVEKTHIQALLARKACNDREQKAKDIIEANLGETCALCVNSCPVDKALGFEMKEQRQVVSVKDECVGCGVCEEVCFAGVIKIIPHKKHRQKFTTKEQ